jgi:ATP-binding cassette subfamily C protein
VVIYFTTRFGRRVKALKTRENAAFEAFQEALSETLTAIQQIRAANRERHYMARMIDRAREIRDFSASYTWKSDAGTRASTAIFMFGVDGFRALGILAVLISDLTIGQMFAVFSYLWFMLTPVQDLLSVQYAFHSADAALKRVNDLIAIHLEPAWPHQDDPFSGRRTVGVELRDVSFAYGDGPLVLDGVSLHIAPGEKVALVGASGGGKTTLVQILIGLYPARSGSVLYGGVPVEEIGLELVRDNVATVLQHPALFNDSVRGNLTLGRSLPDQALWQALEVAQLREVVEGLPEGLDTLVGRGGVRLSGGQRQRLAVARMALSDPRVVILDEATSALDTETEGRLHRALGTFLAGRTTVIIAHRLSAVRQADRVLVFEDGHIVEQGRHEELIEGEGLYAALYRRQAR